MHRTHCAEVLNGSHVEGGGRNGLLAALESRSAYQRAAGSLTHSHHSVKQNTGDPSDRTYMIRRVARLVRHSSVTARRHSENNVFALAKARAKPLRGTGAVLVEAC